MWSGLARRLEGRLVRLEPLTREHGPGLRVAAADPAIWRWMAADASSDEAFAAWLEEALESASRGSAVPFTVLWKATGEAIGSTRYGTLRPEHRGLEIGWTWLAPRAWGTGANAEAKLLLLEHAFERLGCIRVEFKTDARNERSRRALTALPTRFEGIFRKHMLVRDGDVRDSAYYAITDDDWPAVAENLRRRVAAKG